MASPAGDLLALTDDNLAEILIRLPTLEDLGRACVACPAFRRVITGHSFLRRLRALHPPSLLGIVSNVFTPAEPPHPYAAAAGDFVAVDFQCSFLPSSDRWRRRDLRDGRILFSAGPEDYGAGLEDSGDDHGRGALLFRDLAVCDPIHRRYLLLPPIPDNLVALVDQQELVEFQPFLAPASDDDEGGTSFRVISLAECKSRLFVFEFSSSTGQWHASEFEGWKALTAESVNPDKGFMAELSTRYYAHGCFCWVMNWLQKQKLLVLDERTMQFSSSDIPFVHPMKPRIIVEGEKGKFGHFSLHSDIVRVQSKDPMIFYRLHYTVLQGNDGQSANKQQQPPLADDIISLPDKYRYNILGVAGGYLLVQGIPENLYALPLSERPGLDCFSVNLKTLELEWFCETKYPILLAELYVGFPLSLSSPTI